MREFRRGFSLLLALLLVVTGFPLTAFAESGHSYGHSGSQTMRGMLLAQGSKTALPSLKALMDLNEASDELEARPSGESTQTLIMAPNGEDPSESAAKEAENENEEAFRAARESMTRDRIEGGHDFALQTYDLAGQKILSHIQYKINRDSDDLPVAISWTLTYYAPKASLLRNAFLVIKNDSLEEATIENQSFAEGEEAALAERKKAEEKTRPLFAVSTESKEAEKDGFYRTMVTTPLHFDAAMKDKLSKARGEEAGDARLLEEVKQALDKKTYSLDIVTELAGEKILHRIQIDGKGHASYFTNGKPVSAAEQVNVTGPTEKRAFFVSPNMDDKEVNYEVPSFSLPDQIVEGKAKIRVYDFVEAEDGFYDFKVIEESSLKDYQAQLVEAEDKDVEDATLKVRPGQFAVTLVEEEVKEKKDEPGLKEHSNRLPEESVSEFLPEEESQTLPSEASEEREESQPSNEPEDEPQSANREENRPKLPEDPKETIAQTLDILKLSGTPIGALFRAPQPSLDLFGLDLATRKVIIEVVDMENPGVKVPGAVVRITGKDMVEEVTTDENGKAVLENVNAGSYEVVQVSAPKGYLPNQSKISFTFSPVETEKYVRIDNAKDLGTELYYIDGTVSDDKDHSRFIANVELELRAYQFQPDGSKGKRVEEFTRIAYTDEKGHYSFNNLDPQYIYEVALIEAPYEYAFIEEEPTIQNHRIATDIKFRDPQGNPILLPGGAKYKESIHFYLGRQETVPVPVVIINHETGDREQAIVGSTFRILNARGEAIKEKGIMTTDGQGKITLSLRGGRYTIEQLTTDGRHLIPNKQTAIRVQGVGGGKQEVFFVANPLKDVTSARLSMDAVINWGELKADDTAEVIIKQNGAVLPIKPEKVGSIYRFSHLRKYDDNHEQYDYRIILKDHPEYYATYVIENGVVNINVHKKTAPIGPGGTVTIMGNKAWYNDGDAVAKRPDTVTVVLLADGKETGYSDTLSEAKDWKYVFKNMPEFDKDGHKIKYTVREVNDGKGDGAPGYHGDPSVLGKNIINTKIDGSKINGEFSLIKKDGKAADAKGLAGATFTLTGVKDNGQALDPAMSQTTDVEGKLRFTNIPPGNYVLRESVAPDRYEPSTESWKVEVAGDGRTILVGSGVETPDVVEFGPDPGSGKAFVMDADSHHERTLENRKAINELPYQKPLYVKDGLSPEEKAKKENQVGDISKRILNTVDKNLNEYQIELTVQGRGRTVFGQGEKTDIVLVVDHSASVYKSRNDIEINRQVRNIVSAFSDFNNVEMGYVEYAGVGVADNSRLKNNSFNNFNEYEWPNGVYESNETYDRDPAVINSVELTSPGKLATHPKFATNSFPGGTFTQRGLLRAKEILDKGQAKAGNKHIILITDGGPTVTFHATGNMANGTDPKGRPWAPIYRPNENIPMNMADVPESRDRYNGRASGFDKFTLRGDGGYYQFGTSRLFNSYDGYNVYPTKMNKLDYAYYMAGNDKVIDNVYATVSTVRDLTDQGIEITTLGYNLKTLNNYGAFNGQEKFIFPQIASSPDDYSGYGAGVGDEDNAVTDVYNRVAEQFYLNSQNKSKPTIEDAVVTDPMGDGVDLYLGEDGVFNEKDYILVASDGSIYKNGRPPEEGLLKDVKLTYDPDSRQFVIKGLTLGAEESVSLYYSVRLKKDYRNGEFTPTNKTTTLLNKDRLYQFPVPQIRDRSSAPIVHVSNQTYSGRFRILKVNQEGKPLSGAYFLLTDAAGKEVMIQPSDQDGVIAVNNLKPGSYTLKEVEAPAGYVVSNYLWDIVVDAKGATTISRKASEPENQPANEASIALQTMAMRFASMPLTGPVAGPAPIGMDRSPMDYRMSATTRFNDIDKNNKKFDVHHELVGETVKKPLDLYFLLSVYDNESLNDFNNRIQQYSERLERAGYQGYINIIYGGYSHDTTKYTYWAIGETPSLRTDVVVGRSLQGSYMDRALEYANDLLRERQYESSVKIVNLMSSGQNPSEEAYYAKFLGEMYDTKTVSHYIYTVNSGGRVNALRDFLLYDTKNPLPKEVSRDIEKNMHSRAFAGATPAWFENRVNEVYRDLASRKTAENERLRLPLAANIHLVPNSALATIRDTDGRILRSVNVYVATDPVTGLTTLTTDPITLEGGQRLVWDYSVTLQGDYHRAISYPVYAPQAVKWVDSSGQEREAAIKPAYISDPGQNLEIKVVGLQGYHESVQVNLKGLRPDESNNYQLKNDESALVTIRTFDEEGNTQGPDRVQVEADPAPNNYAGPVIDKSRFPKLYVIYQRKALDLTVRKVFNNRLPKAGESVQVTLVAKVDGQEVDLNTIGYSQPAVRSMTQKRDASGQPIEGVYETVYKILPVTYQGKEIEYSIKDESSGQTQGDVTIRKEQSITDFRPDEDVIKVEETEIPVVKVVNSSNELAFKKVGESTEQRDKNGNIIVDSNGNPILSEDPLQGAEFELRRETAEGSTVVKGYEHIISGPNGEFSFKNLPPGDYGVYETKPVLGYELPVQAVATFTIGANGKPVDGSIKVFKERTKQDGDFILGVQKTLKNNVHVETAITQLEATDHNIGNRKMLFTQRIYVNRNKEYLTEATFNLFSAAADNPIVNGSYKVYRVKPENMPPRMNFQESLDVEDPTQPGQPKYELVKEVSAPADLSKISIGTGEKRLPSNDFYIIEVKGELHVHDDKFTSKMTMFISAAETPGHTHPDGFKPSDSSSIITAYRKGKEGSEVDIMTGATQDPGSGAYLVKNYRGSTFFSVQKMVEGENRPLAGATFKLWAALGKNFEIVETEHVTKVTTGGEEVTDKNGIVTFDNLPVNYNFYLEETQTAPGFVLPDYLWLVQIRPTSYLKGLHEASIDWHDYMDGSTTEAEAKEKARSIAYNQMLYPYGGPNRTPDQIETDKTADKEGFKVFVYKTDSRRPLIIHPKDEHGVDLPADTDPDQYKKDKYDDVIAEQSYGQHPTITGMWYRKGWVNFEPTPATGEKGQMMPINEYGDPIHKEWKNPAVGWKGETVDGVSGATIRPLIVKDWIKEARDFDGYASGDQTLTSPDFQNYRTNFQKTYIKRAGNLTVEGQELTSVLGVTNKPSQFFINKVDEDGKPLEGAEFLLYKMKADGSLEATGIPPSKIVKNQFIFEGLTEGVYILKESKAPEGYQEADRRWKITVDKDGAVVKKEEESLEGEAIASRSLDTVLLAEKPGNFETTLSGGPAAFARLLTERGLLPRSSRLSDEKALTPSALVYATANLTRSPSPVYTPLRAAGDYYAKDNENKADPAEGIYREGASEGWFPEDLQKMGVYIYDISDVNRMTGRGTFKAKIYVDASDVELTVPGTVPGQAEDRKLYLNMNPGMAIESVKQVSIHKRIQDRLSFNNTYSGFPNNQPNNYLKTEKRGNISRIDIGADAGRNKYFFEIEGTYDNASNEPVRLKANFESHLTVRGDGKWESKANAESQVYHYDRYLVRYMDQNGGSYGDETVRYGNRPTQVPTPTKQGYILEGWTENGQKVDPSTLKVTSDHNLVAQWKAAISTVTFYREKGEDPITSYTRQVNTGESLGWLPDTSRMGYQYVLAKKNAGFRFAGWQDDQGRKYAEETPIQGDVSLYPIWKEITDYTVYFFDHNKSLIPEYTLTVKKGQSYNQTHPGGLPTGYDSMIPGYELEGWYDGLETTSNKYSGDEAVTRDINLFARVKAKSDQKVITFYMLDDRENIDYSKTQTRTVDTGSLLKDIPKPQPEKREGYTFSGWSYFNNGYVPYDFETFPFWGNFNLYGYWIANVYTVRFQSDDGSLVKEVKAKHGDYIAAPALPAREGYRFVGWKSGDKLFDGSVPVTQSDNYVATWEKLSEDEVQVTFDSNGGTPLPPVSVKKGQPVGKPKDPTKDGFVFDGWLLDGKPYDFSQPVQANLFLKASWRVKSEAGGALTVVNKKKEFEGEFTINKFYKQSNGNRANLKNAYFELTKYPGAKKPESFDAKVYAEQYKHPQWLADLGLFRTDDNGKITFQHLTPGVYRVQEKTPPGGYLANAAAYVVVVNEIGNTVIVPESSYDPDKYPVEVDQGTGGDDNPDRPQPQRTTPRSLDGDIKVENYSLTPSHQDGVVYPLKAHRLVMNYTMRLPEDVIPGDSFTITLDRNLNWNGIRLNPEAMGDITTENGQVVATMTGSDIDSDGNPVRTLTYKLTDYVKNRTDIVIKQSMTVFVDPNQVTTNKALRFTNVIAGLPQESNTIQVNYDPYFGSVYISNQYSSYTWKGHYQELRNYLGGRIYENRDSKEVILYYYVFGYNYGRSNDYQLKVEARGRNNQASDIDLSDQSKIKVDVYETYAYNRSGNYNTTGMPPSYGPQVMDTSSRNDALSTGWYLSRGSLIVPLGQEEGRFGYIVKVTLPFHEKPEKDGVDLYSLATLYGNTEFTDGYQDWAANDWLDYENYLYRHKNKAEASGQDRVNVVLTKRGLLGKEGENRATGKLLPGAGFTLTNNEGFKDYAVTGEDGKLTFQDLKPGRYFLEETLTPKGYTPVAVVWDITVHADGSVTVDFADDRIEATQEGLTVWNFKTPVDKPTLDFPNIPNRIDFIKEGDRGAPLEGVIFELYRKNSEGLFVKVMGEEAVTSAKDGSFSFENLVPGDYEIRETRAPEGYLQPIKAVATFTVDRDTGQIVNVLVNGRRPTDKNIIRNLRPMAFGLEKIDGNGNKIGVGRVEFTMAAAPGNPNPVALGLESLSFDLTKKGPFFTQIPAGMDGEYILTEKTAPTGYTKSDYRYHIAVDQAGRTIKLLKVTNGQGEELDYLKMGKLTEVGPKALYSESESEELILNVVNLQPQYPSTGGTGPSRWFARIGGFLMLLSAAWYVANNRKKDGKKLGKGGGAYD